MHDTAGLLFSVFECLRKSGLPLGVGDYLLALQTLRAGKGLEDLDSLKFLCRLLWAKSREDQELFDDEFARLVEPHLQPIAPRQAATSTEDSIPQSESDSDDTIGQTPVSNADGAERPVLAAPARKQGVLPLSTLGGTLGSSAALRAAGSYQLTPRSPISQREMTGIWRHLRRLQRKGPLVDLDVDGTVQSICRNGRLLRPVLRARRRNQARLLVLRDRSASMAPFGFLLDTLVEGIRRGGLLAQTSLYYFDNFPTTVLARHSGGTGHRMLETVLAEHGKGICVLILSDGGAARGTYRTSRVEGSRAFLKRLANFTYLYCWINPLPLRRWRATSAEDVARMAPMFPLDREGLIDAVNILRGHPFPPGVRLDAGS